MRRFPDNYLPRLLEGGEETRTLEFKSRFRWDDQKSLWLQEKVIQAILGLSNTPSGGVLLVGIKQDGSEAPELQDMTEDQIRSFGTEGLKAKIDGFASSATAFDHGTAVYLGKTLVVFQVSQFARRPIICKKDGLHQDKILREGEIYVRSTRAQYSTRRATAEELEEIIDIAVEKELARFRKRVQAVDETVTYIDKYRAAIKDLE